MDANKKLTQFMEAVNRSTDAQIAQTMAQAEEESAGLIARAQVRSQTEAERELEQAKKRIDAKYQKRMSQVGYRGRTALLSRRHTLLTKLFAELYQKLTEFAASEDYQPWMESLLKKHPPEAGAVILLRKADLAMAERLRTAAGTECTFRADPVIRIGGLSVLSADGRKCDNHTLDEAFSAQQRSFYRNHSFDGGNE